MKKKVNNAKPRKQGFATVAIHAGQEPDELTGAVAPPIYPTSTYVQQDLGKNKGYEYARVSNPTRTRLEQNMAAMVVATSAQRLVICMEAVNVRNKCFLRARVPLPS